MAKRRGAGSNADDETSSYQKVFRGVVATPEFAEYVRSLKTAQVRFDGRQFTIGMDRPQVRFRFALLATSQAMPQSGTHFVIPFSLTEAVTFLDRSEIVRGDELAAIVRATVGQRRHPRDAKPIVGTYFCKMEEILEKFPSWVRTRSRELGLDGVETRAFELAASVRTAQLASPEFTQEKDDCMKEHVKKTIGDVMLRFKDQPDELLEAAVREFTMRHVMGE